MKNIMPLFTVAVLVTACQQEVLTAPARETSASVTQQMTLLNQMPNSVRNISLVKFDRLADSKKITKFRVSLQANNGQVIDKNTPVQPNTTYQVVVEGEAPAQFILKMGEGFEIVQSPSVMAAQKAVYVIKTTTDVLPKLYLSVMPLQLEQNTLTKGRAVGFLLPQ